MIRTDIKLTDNGDFPFADIMINGVYYPTLDQPSDEQHKLDIINNNVGSFKLNPSLGFGVIKYLNSENAMQAVFVNLSKEMAKCGYNVKVGAVRMDKNGQLIIDPSYISNNY
jgi:hypothetical protein